MNLRGLMLPLILVGLFSATGFSQANELNTRLDQIIRFEVENKRFMGSVLVVRDDRMLFSQSYGFGNIASNTPNTAATRYPIASPTKQFTAAAILLLETEGMLKLDAPIKTYWPDAPAAWGKVTLFHLLSHTSGIPDVTESTEYSQWVRAGTPAKDILEYFRDKPLKFEPGSQYRYSNVGYILISFLIERISGETYGGFLRDRIFTPLGMNDSGVDSTTTAVARHATGYASRAGDLVTASPMNMSFLSGAGDLYSTTGDMRLWFQGLFGGRLLPPEAVRRMTTPVKEPWALGVAVLTADVGTEKDLTIVTHDGNVYGFSSGFAYFIEDRVMVIVLANVEGDVPAKLKEQLAEVVFGGSVVLPSEKLKYLYPKRI
jgi:CubicO group peptidase (beta-lactamase class C family)